MTFLSTVDFGYVIIHGFAVKNYGQFIEIFSTLRDPRIERCKKHLLTDILYMTIVAVLCGAIEWEEIEMIKKEQKS